MDEEIVSINVTKRDKVYISIILCLVLVCVCLAIVLPRPYKIVEVDKPVYEKAYQKVYDTKNIFLISESSSLYDQANGYTDVSGNVYGIEHRQSYMDTGDLRQVNVSIKVNEADIEVKKTVLLNEYLVGLIVSEASLNEFGVVITIDSNIMSNLNVIFMQSYGDSKANPLDYYLFEFEFEKAVVNYVVAFISE